MGHNHLNPNPTVPDGDTNQGVAVANAGRLEIWSDSQKGYRNTRGNHFGSGDGDAGRSRLSDLIRSSGTDTSEAFLDEKMNEQMPPFVSINYLIKT
jgi:hypothetical protein